MLLNRLFVAFASALLLFWLTGCPASDTKTVQSVPATSLVNFSAPVEGVSSPVECNVSFDKEWFMELDDLPSDQPIFGYWRGVFYNYSGKGCAIVLITPLKGTTNMDMARVRYCHEGLLRGRCIYAEVAGVTSGELSVAKEGRYLDLKLLGNGKMLVKIHRLADRRSKVYTIFTKHSVEAQTVLRE